MPWLPNRKPFDLTNVDAESLKEAGELTPEQVEEMRQTLKDSIDAEVHECERELPPVDIMQLMRDAEQEAAKAQAWNDLVDRQQRVLREWKAAEAAEDPEGVALCREAARQLVTAFFELQGFEILGQTPDGLILLDPEQMPPFVWEEPHGSE